MFETTLSTTAARRAGASYDSSPSPLEDDGAGDAAIGLSLFSLRALACLAVLATVTMTADLVLPIGDSGGLLYLAVALLGWWLARPWHVVVLAALASGLAIAGFVVPLGGVAAATREGLTGRALALMAIWAVAAVLIAAKRRERQWPRGARRPSGDPARAAAPPSAERRHPSPTPEAAEGIAQQRAALALLHHDLRTPLNAIIGFSEMGRREMLGPIGNERYREYMADINLSGYQLLGVIESLLERRQAAIPDHPDDQADPEPTARSPQRAAGA